MAIRETIARHSTISTIVVICVVIGCIVVIAMELSSASGELPTKDYFTIDDGKTWFVDSTSKLPPFDHDGAKAVRCYVFEGKDGKFAGLLEKYGDSTLQQLQHLAPDAARPNNIPVLVKKPGEQHWNNAGPAQEAMILMHISAPDGSDVEMVAP